MTGEPEPAGQSDTAALAVDPENRGMRGFWSARIVLAVWLLITAGSVWIAASTAVFPTSITAMVSNLEAVQADRLVAAHFVAGQNETILYCTQSKDNTVADSSLTRTGIVSLDEACASANSPESTGKIRVVASGFLSATPRTLILEGIDLARSVREGDQGVTKVVPASRTIPESHDLRQAEAWSLALTVAALLLCYRSVSAALMTFAFGSIIAAVTWGALIAASRVFTPPFVVVSISSLLALALGADLASQAYMARITSGRMAKATAVVACAGVATAFLPLFTFPPSGLRALAFGALIASATAFAGASTLIPAASSLLSARFPRRSQTERHRRGPIPAIVCLSRRKPVASTALALALLLPFCVSGFWELRNPHSVLPISTITSSTTVRAQFTSQVERLTKGTIEFVVNAPWSPATETYIAHLVGTIADHPDFSSPVFVQWSVDKQIAVVTGFIPEESSVNAFQIAEAVRAASEQVGVRTYIGGPVMLGAQVDNILGRWSIWGAFGAICFAFLVLTAGFRTPVMVTTMVVGAGISSLAALGVLAWAINRGISAGPFQINSQEGLDPWAPLIVTCIVIATSTSYVSLVLGQQRQGTQRSPSFSETFASALTGAPQLTTAAAVSMIAIGVGFTASGVSSLQQAGAGLAIALAIQATVVRTVLTPALLELIDRIRRRMVPILR